MSPDVTDSTVFTPHGAPVVRKSLELMTVREVAAVLKVSRATVYALMERGEFVHIYGHLDLGDMTDALGLLSFTSAPTAAADVLSLRRGAPVVRNSPAPDFSDDPAETKAPSARQVERSGPSWIRTRDQSVMSRQL